MQVTPTSPPIRTVIIYREGLLHNDAETIAGDGLKYGEGVQQQMQAQVASFKQASAENNKKLAQYTWKQKVEVLKGGDVKKTMVYQISIGPDGKQQKTEISQPGEKQKKGGGRRGRRIKKKIAQKVEELKDYAERMMSLVGHYSTPDPVRLQEQFKAGKGSLRSYGRKLCMRV